jgi:hypothetical protein
MVQIESLRLRYFPFSHRLTLRLRNVWQQVEIVQLVSRLSNDFTNGPCTAASKKITSCGYPTFA